MSTLQEVFLGLGGNIGCVLKTLRRSCELIQAIPGVSDVTCAPYYLTSPVSDIPQRPYVNTVCRCRTSLSPQALAKELIEIETQLGKVKIAKDAPRSIDIDILFFGSLGVSEPGLQIPHPRWLDRLFVLRPLADLVPEIVLPSGDVVGVRELVNRWPKESAQWVWAVDDLPFAAQSDE
jgi:2-amino-4-hydroxy-6-hydroxymethyldihydropteridine diphosphokinase